MAKKPKPAPFVSTQGKEFDTEIKVTGVGKQFEEVKPATPPLPPVRYEGPALFDEARQPIDNYY